jgi:hypothetical protein
MRSMMRLFVVLAALYAVFPGSRPAAAQAQKDDVVTLKDGRIVRGKIIEFFPNDSTFLMRLTDGTFARFNKADIAQTRKQRAVTDDGTTLKNPALSWLLSFVITGGGQIYNQDVAKGIGLLVIGTAGGVLYLTSDPNECIYNADCATKRTVGGVIALAAWLGSQVEAPIRAGAINRDIRSRGMSLQVWPEPHQLGMSLLRVEF